MQNDTTPLFWLDMEMTGLDVNTEHILEVALIVTDAQMNVLDTYESIIYQPQSIMTNMNEWSTVHHKKTGLTDKVPFGESLEVVEQQLIDILKKHSPKEKAILAGNSIHQDRKFLDKWMEKLSNLLHYRMCDVSSFKIIFEHKYKQKFNKKNMHRALDDIHESIAELKFYLSFIEKGEIPS